MLDKEIILLDYYDGAYGPTLRIDVEAASQLERLKRVFADLAHGEREQTNLLDVDGVKASTNVQQVVLAHDPSIRAGQKALRVIHAKAGVVILWGGASAYWSRCAGLVSGLLEVGRAAHQYLSQEAVDDALIELAFMERVPAVAPGLK